MLFKSGITVIGKCGKSITSTRCRHKKDKVFSINLHLNMKRILFCYFSRYHIKLFTDYISCHMVYWSVYKFRICSQFFTVCLPLFFCADCAAKSVTGFLKLPSYSGKKPKKSTSKQESGKQKDPAQQSASKSAESKTKKKET